MTTRQILSVLLLGLALVFLTGCGRHVVWQQRTSADGDKILVPCCPECEHYVDYDASECRECGVFIRWSERPGEEH